VRKYERVVFELVWDTAAELARRLGTSLLEEEALSSFLLMRDCSSLTQLGALLDYIKKRKKN
jgi:hypothetical protein